MTRLTIDLPDSLHKTLKSLSVMDGQTMRNIAISALERYAVARVKNKQKDDNISQAEATQMLQPFLDSYIQKVEKGQISHEALSDTIEKVNGYLTEEAENKLLKPKIEKIIAEENEETTWEEFKQELEENK